MGRHIKSMALGWGVRWWLYHNLFKPEPFTAQVTCRKERTTVHIGVRGASLTHEQQLSLLETIAKTKPDAIKKVIVKIEGEQPQAPDNH